MKFRKKLKPITFICITTFIGFCFAAPLDYLEAAYNFEENGTDISGNGHDADYAGVSFPAGLVGKALEYDNSCITWTQGLYFTAPDADALDLNHLTLEVWVFPITYSCPMNVLNKWGPPNDRSYNLNINRGRASFFISSNGNHPPELLGSLLPLNQWSHLVATYDGSKMRIYINGVLDVERIETCVPHAGVAPLRIGIDGWGNYPMGGLIENARVYNEALAAEDIADLYAAKSNFPPVADAGPDQAVTSIGTMVQLDGTQSYDPLSNPFTFQWTITEQPAGSGAVLDDPTSETPTFIADKNGSYTIELIVSNDWLSSTPDNVVVSFDNVAPTAVIANGNVSCKVNEAVILNGAGSHDANGDMLSYNWQIVSKPEGSTAAIADASLIETSITPDEAGEYIISLTVSDGIVNSEPVYISIVATLSAEDAITQALQDASEAIVSLSEDAFKNKNMKNTLTGKINEVLLKIEEGDIEGAYNKLRNDVIKKTDGCADGGSVDKNDWIIDCDAQALVYPDLIDALDLLFGLLE